MTVQAIVTGDNSDLIREVAKLYTTPQARIADLTYGKGVFWRKCPELQVTGSDLITVPERPYDFTALPYENGIFTHAVLDPPYIHSPGNHMTDHRYQNAATTKGMLWKDIRLLYAAGMKEAMRIVEPMGGQVWVKCKDQVQSGQQRWCHIDIQQDAVALGLYPRDLFILLPNARTAGGRWDTQHHARKPHSYLWVFERPTRARATQLLREPI